MKIRVRIALISTLALAATACIATTAVAVTPQIVNAGDTICVLNDAGAVQCWGRNDYGETGSTDNPTPAPNTVPGLGSGVVGLGAALNTICASMEDGTVRCWGTNLHAELGQGGTDGAAHPNPVVVPGLSGVTQVSGGFYHLCALINDGTVKCWGNDSFDQMGPGVAANPQTTPVTIGGGLSNVKSVSAGTFHNCALLGDATVKCWGRNVVGELGQGSTSGLPIETPSLVPGVTGVAQLATASATCARLADATIHCWGDNFYGQMGNGTVSAAGVPTPGQVPGLAGTQDLGVMNDSFCVRLPTGVSCWGFNDAYQLGTGGSNVVTSPFTTSFGADVLFMPLSSNGSTLCMIRRGGAVVCAGDNQYKQLGDGSSVNHSMTPVTVPGLDAITIAQTPAGPAELSVTAKPRTDRRRKYFRLRGRIRLEPSQLVAPSEACTGEASVWTKLRIRTSRGRKRTKTYKTAPAIVENAGYCEANFTLKLPVAFTKSRKIKLYGSFPGNASLQATSATPIKYKMPKVRRR